MQWLTDGAVGAILGFLAGIGTGGGSLLLLWLTVIRGCDPQQARTMNLLFFLPCAFVATVLQRKRKNTSSSALLPAIVSGCIAAAAACIIGKNMDTQLMKKLFGILLLIAGIRELLYAPSH